MSERFFSWMMSLGHLSTSVDEHELELKTARDEYVMLRGRYDAGGRPVVQIQKDIGRMTLTRHIDPEIRRRILEIHDWYSASNRYLQSYGYILQIILLAWLRDPDRGPATEDESEHMEADCYWMYSSFLTYISHLQPDRSGIVALQRKIIDTLPPLWKSRNEIILLIQNILIQPVYLPMLMKTNENLEHAMRYMDIVMSYLSLGVNCDRIDDVYVALTKAVLGAYKGDPDDNMMLLSHVTTYVPSVQEFQDALANSRNAWRQHQNGGSLKAIARKTVINRRNNHGRRR